MGLVWYEPDAALTQITPLPRRSVEAAYRPPVETLTPPSELKAPSSAPSVPPSALQTSSEVVTDIETEAATDIAFVKTVTVPAPPIIPDPKPPASPPRQAKPAPVNQPAEVVSRPKKAPKPSKPSDRPYLVQIGAFRNKANANSTVAKFRDKGYQPFIRTVHDREKRVLYRVFLDRAKDKAQAQATAKAFEETEKMDALVMLADNFSQSRSRPQLNRRDAESRLSPRIIRSEARWLAAVAKTL